MNIKAHVMCAAVPHIGTDVGRSIQDAGIDQKFGVVASRFGVHFFHGHTGADYFKHMVRGVQCTFIQELLSFIKPAIAGPASGNVIHQVVMPCTYVV